ncbi:hypothetical protein U9M48_006659 [Paspalum notatum var. saurae]|uniref:Peroxisomal nicotinamide adenine dinucleotide carrier n=1 Tax=Paspalum notatum var. saurae TaxID=547442 RepID=A0AAQ3PUW7_PASNO
MEECDDLTFVIIFKHMRNIKIYVSREGKGKCGKKNRGTHLLPLPLGVGGSSPNSILPSQFARPLACRAAVHLRSHLGAVSTSPAGALVLIARWGSMSSAVVNGLAGAGGGIIAQIITYPLQTVNTRQQTERSAKKRKAGSDATNSSTLFQMLQLIQTEGWGGLYSGLKPSLIGTAASQGIYYYFYQILKNKVEDIAVARGKKGLGDGTVGMLSWLGIAAIAGSINVLLTNPIWVLVTRMQTHTQAERKILESKRELLLKEVSRANSLEVSILRDRLVKLESEKPLPYGTLQAIQEVYRESGIRGFWKGLVPTLIMVCNPSIQFMIYETLAKRLQSKRSGKQLPKRNLTAMEVFLLGAIAKLGATVVTYPLLVVKSRLQAKQEIGRNVMSRYTGTIDAIIKMIRYEGLHGFYKGMGTKIVQSVFAASVLFMVKEELVKLAVLLVARSRAMLITKSKNR